MGKAIDVGIIGVGRWGTNYLMTLNELENANVKCICSRSENTIKAALEKTGSPDVKTSLNYNDIFNDKEIDAVAVVTNAPLHYELAKKALQSNKHVIVEKPVAFHAEHVEELIELSKKMQRTLMAGHLHVFNPGIQKIREDIARGLFGHINYLYSFGAGGPVRKDMSALWDYFPHDVSISLYLLQQTPLSVSASGSSYTREDIEDIVTMNIQFHKKVFVAAIGPWVYPFKKRELMVVGEKLYAAFDDYADNEKLRYFTKDNKTIVPKISDAKPLTQQLSHFLDCIENNKAPITGGEEALRVTKVLEHAQESLIKKGLSINVSQ
jgi:predicted dehydrogenase